MASRLYLFLLLSFIGATHQQAQMVVGADTLVGNEWIRYDQTWYAFPVDADGVYRIPYSALHNAGLPAPLTGADIRLYSLGQQVPVYVSTDGVLQDQDYVEFFGYRNRNELDRFLFLHPDEDLLNPEHSMYSDRRMYYLTVGGPEPQLQVQNLNNQISTPPSPEPFYLHTETILYTASSHDPYYQVNGGGAVSYSSYMHGEGFCKNSEPNSVVTIPTTHVAQGGPDAQLRIRMTSTNYGSHAWSLLWNDQPLDTIHLFELEILDTVITIPLASLLDLNQLKVTTLTPQSRQSLVQIDVTYPHTWDIGGAVSAWIQLRDKGEDSYLILDQFTHGNAPSVVYSTDGRFRMEADPAGDSQVAILWPVNTNVRSLYMASSISAISEITSLTQKNFVDFSGDDTEYVIITHPELMTPGTESEYVQYRSSAAGGGYRAKAYSVLELYDQFGYGIERHPMAIRNFVEWMGRHWPDARMIFLVGRAIEYHRSRYPDTTSDSLFYVPTFGRPGADNLLAATPWDLVPRYPIGRLAIFRPEDLGVYLDKVKEHDQVIYAGQTLEEKAWIKHVMHIGGGKTQTEQRDFKDTLEDLGEELAESDFGATLSYFQKESTDPVAESQSNQVLQRLQEGCSIVNYLGHSSASTFEFNISGPVEWNNKGRYPVFSAMGCSAGQIHTNVFSLSDAYVQTPNEGAIAFVSGSGSQFASALVSWARPWYDYFGSQSYGATLGESIRYGLIAVSDLVDVFNPGSVSYRYLLEQQTLQGDPALQLHPLPGPDYLVDRTSVRIEPQILNANLDSFDLEFSIANIGRNLGQHVRYLIRLQSPEGELRTLKSGVVQCQTFETNLALTLPIYLEGKPGLYRLLITVDPANLIDELPAPDAENNNVLRDNLGVEGLSISVVDHVFTAAWPADFAIVTEAQPMLIATGSDAFAGKADVVIQLDTNALFTSPSRITARFSQLDGPLQWTVPAPLEAGQEYFWRVSVDSVSEVRGYNWSSRSFICMPGSFPGWNQSHFHQLTANATVQVRPDSTGHTFHFANTAINFRNTNRVQNNDLALFPLMIVDGVIRTAFYTGFANQDVNMFVVAIDPVTADYIRNPNPGLYGSVNHLNFDAPCFAFSTSTPESRQNLINFVKEHIPSGHYMFIYSYQRPGNMDYYPEQWTGDEDVYGQSIFTLIEQQYPGSSIRSLAETGSKPFIFLCRKDMGVIEERIATTVEEIINVNFDSPVRLTSGNMTSVTVGPARQWYSIEDQIVNQPDTAGDWSLYAWALDKTLQDTLWIAQESKEEFISLAFLDADAYPFIGLRYETKDSLVRTPSVIDHWRVFYEGYSDIIIRPDLGFRFDHDTLSKGERLLFKTYVENAGPNDIDSVLVQYRITDLSNQTIVFEQMLHDLKSWDTTHVELNLDTGPLSGDYQFVMEVNPHRSPFEINYANNIGIRSFHVLRDDINPVLDVTFDGVHIRDGDLVSARPEIRIRLTDENEFLRLSDTSLFIVRLGFPSDFEPVRLFFTNGDLQFMPAPLTGPNMATVLLLPHLTEDGIYTLEVTAVDPSGNASGDLAYVIHFQVIHEPAISHLYNAPNPFSGSTRFYYTLTGDQSPAHLSLRIYSSLGIRVRELTEEELGPLRVGTHMSTYEWDGTDHTGARLPVGVYFYEFEAADDTGKPYRHLSPFWETAFSEKALGKMIMIR